MASLLHPRRRLAKRESGTRICKRVPAKLARACIRAVAGSGAGAGAGAGAVAGTGTGSAASEASDPAPAPQRAKRATPAPAPQRAKRATPAPAPQRAKRATPAPAPQRAQRAAPAPAPASERNERLRLSERSDGSGSVDRERDVCRRGTTKGIPRRSGISRIRATRRGRYASPAASSTARLASTPMRKPRAPSTSRSGATASR